ncbi:hypothetical protein FM106_13535 [Brachybacterium faecium]|nr:hypothetical protein FM106_13535 [Brachybacterium faecium]
MSAGGSQRAARRGRIGHVRHGFRSVLGGRRDCPRCTAREGAGVPPPSRLTFRVTERTYRTTWGGARPSSQRGIVVDGEPARGAAPHHGADGDPPVADPAPTGATVCTGDPRRRVEQRRP